MYDTKKIEIMLAREEMKVPKINDVNEEGDEDGEQVEETDKQFRERLIKVRHWSLGFLI